MYSFPNLEPVCCSMSSSNNCFLTWIQVSQEAGKVVWYSHCFKNVQQFAVIHTIKGFSIVNEAIIDIFLELSSFFYDPADVGSVISGSSAFSKSILYIWKFLNHLSPWQQAISWSFRTSCQSLNRLGFQVLCIFGSYWCFLLLERRLDSKQGVCPAWTLKSMHGSLRRWVSCRSFGKSYAKGSVSFFSGTINH